MAYGADDYNALLLWLDPTSGAKAQVKMTINSAHTPSDIADAIDTAWAAGGHIPTVFMNNHAALEEINMFSLDLSGSVFIKTNCTAQGQQGGGTTPINASMVCSVLGLLPGRKHRNRMFLPFIDRGFVTDDGARWNPAAISGSDPAAFDNLNSALIGAGVHWKIQNKKDSVLEDIGSLRLNTYIGSQRRRTERFE
jgi:hypothetical protein